MPRKTNNSKKTEMAELKDNKTKTVRQKAPRKSKSKAEESEATKLSCLNNLEEESGESHQNTSVPFSQTQEDNIDEVPTGLEGGGVIKLGDPNFEVPDYTNLGKKSTISTAFKSSSLLQQKVVVNEQAKETRDQSVIPADLVRQKAQNTLTEEEKKKLQEVHTAHPLVIETLIERGYEITETESNYIFEYLTDYNVGNVDIVEGFVAGLRQRMNVSIEKLEQRMIDEVLKLEKIVKDLKQANNDYAQLNDGARANNQGMRDAIAGIKVETPIMKPSHALIGVKRAHDTITKGLGPSKSGSGMLNMKEFSEIVKKKKNEIGGSSQVDTIPEDVQKSEKSKGKSSDINLTSVTVEDQEVQGILEFLGLNKSYLKEISSDERFATTSLKSAFSQLTPAERESIQKDPLKRMMTARDTIALARSIAISNQDV
ncbi:47K [red clover associated varicosavirus]|uniref:47K n=1 Tax=red clover associated varicosavirus TaxID=2848052 RepID=A0A2R2Z7M5_9RHAB|nr:47K [Red clover varicosavirus]AUD57855.1 47K [red clover associated varicosavirus]